MSRNAERPATLKRDGDLSLSFVNTASEKRRGPREYAELLLWLECHGALGSEESARFQARAAEQPEEAEAASVFALHLRDVLSWIFNELADRRELSPDLTEAFNGYLAALPRRHLVPDPEAGLRWGWVDGREDELERPFWSVVTSAARLLTSKSFSKIRRCAGEDRWLEKMRENTARRQT